MSEFFTIDQIETLNQPLRDKRIKIEILNLDYKVIDVIEGWISSSSGSMNVDASSDNRRSSSFEIYIDDSYDELIKSKYSVKQGSLIWLDKYIKVYVGINNLIDDEIVWYNQGVLLIDEPSYNYSASEHMLSFNGVDLMTNLTENRRGQLTNLATTIEAYELDSEGNVISKTKIRDVLVSLIKDFTMIKKYYIAPMDKENEYLPEDLNFDDGATVYNMFSKVMEYLPDWEMFFDMEGIFTIQPIPKGENDPIYHYNDIDTQTEQLSVDFNNVKNLVIVRGMTHDTDYFIANDENNLENVKINGNILQLKFEEYDETKIENNSTLGFVWLDNQYSPMLNKLEIISDDKTTSYPLVDFENTTNNIPEKRFQPDSIIVLRYNSMEDGTKYWDYLSTSQAEAYAVQQDINSPFYINKELIGENYWGGLTECENHINYTVILNNDFVLANLNDNVQITLMPNIYNKENTTLTVVENNGKTLAENIPIGNIINNTFVPIVAEKWSNDFTIYKLTYKYYIENNEKKYYFNFDGRLQTFTYYLSGGEYENIYSNSLAQQRANHELYIHSNLNDIISLTAIPNYTLDVNKKITYTSLSTNETFECLIQTLELPYTSNGDSMTLTANRIYTNNCYLTIIESDNSSVNVYRGSEKLKNGDIVYKGDSLIIMPQRITGYQYPIININGEEFEGTVRYIVKDNVIIKTSAEILPTLDEASWAFINNICSKGYEQEYYKVGDTKNITMSDGKNIEIAIMGFNHELDYDTGESISITFGMTGARYLEAMNNDRTYKGGYAGTDMEKYLTNTIVAKLPSDLSSILKSARKEYNRYNIENNSIEIEEAKENIWLFSRSEVTGSQDIPFMVDSTASITIKTLYYNFGKQYEYWKTVKDGSKEKDRIKSQTEWWLRDISRYVQNTDMITWGIINENGVTNSLAGNLGLAISFCFGIGKRNK